MESVVTCACRKHTLYTYTVTFEGVEGIPDSLKKYANREYTGVHSCRDRSNCSTDFSDRHYLGSASHEAYQRIKRLFPDSLILTRQENFNSCLELDIAEEMFVDWNYVLRKDTFNQTIGGSRRENPALKACEICSGSAISHKRECALFRLSAACKECSGRHGHYKHCSSYNAAANCNECSGISGNHYKNCSKFTQAEPCTECKVSFGHLRVCSKFRSGPSCEECSGLDGKHRKQCSKFKSRVACSKCGSRGTSHLKHCSLYVLPKTCSDCKSPSGKHKKICSKYAEPNACLECSGKKSHKKICSLYKVKEPCSDCGSLNNGSHRINCPKHKMRNGCIECGSQSTHKENCSKYAANDCEICEGRKGKHKKSCSTRMIELDLSFILDDATA